MFLPSWVLQKMVETAALLIIIVLCFLRERVPVPFLQRRQLLLLLLGHA